MTTRQSSADQTQHMTAVEVIPGKITIGSKAAALDYEWQRSAGITHTLCCAAELKRLHSQPRGAPRRPPWPRLRPSRR